MAVILQYTSSRQRLNWFGRSSLVAAGVLFHFSLSVGVWLMWWGATLFNPYLRPGLLKEIAGNFSCFAPALCLLILSIAAYRLALKRRTAWRLLVVILLSAVAFFLTDVHFHRYQVSVDIASQAYWDNGGNAHHYFTWWWYNDR